MSSLEIDWEQERPDDKAITKMWTELVINPIFDTSNGSKNLIDKLACTHVNGGAQIHKFQIEPNDTFNWFCSRNRLDEINFMEEFFNNGNLSEYFDNLKVLNGKPSVEIKDYKTDIYGMPGTLAQILGLGGAYKNIDSSEAWQVSTNFIESEFQNRFEEVLEYYYVMNNSDWFYDIAWDYSFMLIDKRTNQVTIIDITDTD